MFSHQLIRRIEDYFRHKTGRPVCYLPSARLGLYASLFEMFPPGAGLVVSPVTDDIVLFAVLAAGLKPIFVDLEPNSGGLKPETISSAATAGAAGVLTSNLYGIPDDAAAIRTVCDKHGLLLIEDCAHAMGCTVAGKIVGTFGDISVFSLAKHINGLGGIVTADDPARVAAIRQRSEQYVKRLSVLRSFLLSSRLMASDILLRFPVIRQFLKPLLSPLLYFLPNPYDDVDASLDRQGHRVPIQCASFEHYEKRKGLGCYERYLQVDNLRFLQVPCWYILRNSLTALMRFEETARVHKAAPSRLYPAMSFSRGLAPENAQACYYRIPLFSRNRDHHLEQLTAMGVDLNHIYHPSFPDYFPPELFLTLVSDENTIDMWSRSILPIAVQDIETVNAYFSRPENKNDLIQVGSKKAY